MEHSPKCKVVWIGGAREKMGLQVQHVRQPYFSMKETFMRWEIIYCGYSKKDLASCGNDNWRMFMIVFFAGNDDWRSAQT